MSISNNSNPVRPRVSEVCPDSAIIARIPRRYGPLAAQSLDDPDPYSLPTRAIRGIFSLMYLSAASKISICKIY
ncbi:GSCOCG00003928001-RA-CDS [Cotesia congregata]|nr:GSCOCG00003928001-RA-CDS [Cotesia congregata]